MKNAKLYLALYENWEAASAEELYKWAKALVSFLNVGLYIVHSVVKNAVGLLLNANYLVRRHSPHELPEEVHNHHHHNRWIA